MTFADASVEVMVRVLFATLQSERSLFSLKRRDSGDYGTHRTSLAIDDRHFLVCASVFNDDVDLCTGSTGKNASEFSV